MSDQQQNKGNVEQFGYKQELKRALSLRDVVLYGVLFMVIIAPQSIFGEIQVASGGMTPLVYIVGFVAISFTALSYMRTVSYTHLDVYKRQGYTKVLIFFIIECRRKHFKWKVT